MDDMRGCFEEEGWDVDEEARFPADVWSGQMINKEILKDLSGYMPYAETNFLYFKPDGDQHHMGDSF